VTRAFDRPTIAPRMPANTTERHGSRRAEGRPSGPSKSEPRTGKSAGGNGQPITVLIVDDERTFGEALGVALGRERDVEVVDVTTDAGEAVRAAAELQPDVVLIDAAMPGMNGLEATRRIKETTPEAQVLILSGRDEEHLLARAIQAGAVGLLSKTDTVADLVTTVRRAHRGEPLIDEDEINTALRRLRHRRRAEDSAAARLARLTPREREILQLMAQGKSSTAIAQQLGMSAGTLRTHAQNFITKLGVHSKMEALVLAIRHGVVTTVDVTTDAFGQER
jgi:DNA-binding NarL/FixJ family response regulator